MSTNNTENYSDEENQSDNMSDTENESAYESDMLDTDDVVNQDQEINITDIINEKEDIKMEVIEKSKRISKNKLTKFELVRILGERTKQLTMGAKPLIKQNKETEKLTYKEIAIEEIKNNMVPLKIKRPVGITMKYGQLMN